MIPVFLLSLLINCTPVDTPKESVSELNALIIQQNDECLEEVMSSWFEEFHKAQNQGLDMHEADQKAISKTLSDFKDGC